MVAVSCWAVASTAARYAQWLAREAGTQRLVLAVDAANEPAIAAYGTAAFPLETGGVCSCGGLGSGEVSVVARKKSWSAAQIQIQFKSKSSRNSQKKNQTGTPTKSSTTVRAETRGLAHDATSITKETTGIVRIAIGVPT